MKPFLGLGGLEIGLRRPEDTVLSTGEFHIPGQARGYRDDKHGGHGRVDLVQAIAQSVNTYFYSLAYDMGIDRLQQLDGQVRLRQADRHRSRRRKRRRAAVAGMEARPLATSRGIRAKP